MISTTIKKTKNGLGKEFKDFLIKDDFFKSRVQNHIEVQGRVNYQGFSKEILKKAIKEYFDNMNQNYFEHIEKTFGQKLTKEEKKYYKDEFIKEAVKIWK